MGFFEYRVRKKTVMITADEGVTHGAVVHVLDIAKQTGADKLSLVKKAAAPAARRVTK